MLSRALKVVSILLLVVVAPPVALIAVLRSAGYGPQGTEVHLPGMVLYLQFVLAVILPPLTATIVGWWRMPVVAVVGLGWLVYIMIDSAQRHSALVSFLRP
jgi:hypothetical protein